MITEVKCEIGGRELSFETGRVAKQADGAVWVRYGGTVIIATVCASKESAEDRDFFPLTVDFREKTFAGGKIPGGFFKREGRPSEKEVLSSRMIDRPIRPLFPEGFFNEVQILITVLSSDQENEADQLGINGASAALAISPIPFDEIIGAVRVGRINGNLVVNPTVSQMAESDVNLIMAGNRGSITMVEGGCKEISERDLLDALAFGHEEIKKIIDALAELKAKAGKTAWEFTPPEKDVEFDKEVRELIEEKTISALSISEKIARGDRLREIVENAYTLLEEKYPESKGKVRAVQDEIEKELMRKKVLEEGIRIDGRQFSQIRPVTCELSVLPRTHGSAIFTRGETQALVVVTLGSKADEQRIDDIIGESTKSYMLHYNFPPYSVGEVRRFLAPGRREIGHGALAERAISPVVPAEEHFPYTIRVVSEIMESNGSSSMATVCGGSLSLMDAGVPIKTHVAGIAMGLVTEGDKFAVLTDIQGAEDHHGDMDFKVTGTSAGITAFQMDLKIKGVTLEILEKALEQAKDGRLELLAKMSEAIPQPRSDLSEYAPRITILKIKQSKIGEVIGPGGKNIRHIIETTGAKIDIEDDGSVFISSTDSKASAEAEKMIKAIVEEPELDKVYDGVVRRVANFGAFVEILPGTDGLLHISEIANRRIERVEDVLRVGDHVQVKVIEIGDDGKIRLSRKALLKDDKKHKPA
jgi:polyribonucleotide nucleotidyltransferase